MATVLAAGFNVGAYYAVYGDVKLGVSAGASYMSGFNGQLTSGFPVRVDRRLDWTFGVGVSRAF